MKAAIRSALAIPLLAGLTYASTPTGPSCERTAVVVRDGQAATCARLTKSLPSGVPALGWACAEQDRYLVVDGPTGFWSKLLVPDTTASLRLSLQADSTWTVLPDAPVEEADAWPPTGADGYWGLDRIDQAEPVVMGKPHIVRGGAGDGVTVYVADSGVRSTHLALAPRVLSPLRFRTCAGETCTSHGTAMAGLIAGRGVGVAEAARIVPLDVLGGNGKGCLSDVLSALDHVSPGRAGSVVNMSLACKVGRDCGETLGGTSVIGLIDRKVTQLFRAGTLTVVAAGNDVEDGKPGSRGPFGDLRDLKDAIVVGKLSRDEVPTPRWAGIDLYAPGDNLWTAGTDSDTAGYLASDTSAAAAFVSGVVAADLGVSARTEPNLSPGARVALVRERLLARASCATAPGGGTVPVVCHREDPTARCGDDAETVTCSSP